MSDKIKRSEFKTFVNTTPDSTATYNLLGDGVTTGAIEMNPETSTETDIHQDTASIAVESYAPTMPIEATAKKGDAVFEFMDGLRRERAVLDAAETDVINVWIYETPTLGEYPAEKQTVSIAVDKFGGEGGKSAKLNYTINYVGDPVIGTFNPSTKVFTPNPNAASLSALSIGALVLTPTFDPDWLWYTATTAATPQTGSATATDPAAALTLKNEGVTVDTDTGTISGSLALSAGGNTITVEVVVGTETVVYTVEVTKT
jgi:hypothetical protein